MAVILFSTFLYIAMQLCAVAQAADQSSSFSVVRAFSGRVQATGVVVCHQPGLMSQLMSAQSRTLAANEAECRALCRQEAECQLYSYYSLPGTTQTCNLYSGGVISNYQAPRSDRAGVTFFGRANASCAEQDQSASSSFISMAWRPDFTLQRINSTECTTIRRSSARTLVSSLALLLKAHL